MEKEEEESVSPGLKNRIESFVEQKQSVKKKLMARDVYALTEELQLHQIELEMQNEELRRIQSELETARNKYVDLYDMAPVGYFTLGEKNFINRVNLMGAEMLGLEMRRLLGKPFSHFIFKEDQDKFYFYHRQLSDAMATRPQPLELRLMGKEGRPFFVRLDFSLFNNSHGAGLDRVRVTVTDISQRKDAEAALEKANAELEQRVEARAAELEIANQLLRDEIERHKATQRAITKNHEVQDILKSILTLSLKDISQEEMLERTLELVLTASWLPAEPKGIIFLAEEDPQVLILKAYSGFERDLQPECVRVPIGRCICGRAITEKKVLFVDTTDERHENCYPNMTPHSHYCVHISTQDRSLGVLTLFLGVGHFPDKAEGDFLLSLSEALAGILKRKQIEEAVQLSEERLRHLSTRLLDTQEQERKIVARDLHDSIGSNLAGIKYSLERKLKEEMSEGSPSKEITLEYIIDHVKRTIESTRRIYMDLRPSILDDMGILSTINWFCREFQELYADIEVSEELDLNEADIPDHLKIIVFRIVQESFNNIAKHSSADHVELCLRKAGDLLELIVKDNGKGFSLEEINSRGRDKRGIGLAGMKGRVELSGGLFSVRTGKEEGTTVQGRWPGR